MPDIEKGLPVRTEDDLQQKVQVKIVDFTDPNGADKQTEVSEKLVHIREFAADSDGTKVQKLLSQEGHSLTNGDYDAATNKRPSSQGTILHDRVASPSEADQNFRPTGIASIVDDAKCADVAIRDEQGNPYTANNPLPVTLEESEGEETIDFKEDVVAADGSSTHTYTVADGKVFLMDQLICRASGRCKSIIEVGDGAVSEVFAVKAVGFQSEDQSKGADIEFSRSLKVVGTANGTTIRITKENRDDDDSQSIYTTIVGLLKDA